MGSQAGWAGDADLPRRREDLAGLAVFTLDDQGRVTGWPESAARLFGPAPGEATGQTAGQIAGLADGEITGAAIGSHVCDTLLTGPGQRGLVEHALAEVAAGRTWTSTVAGGRLGEGRFAIRCEPLAGPANGPSAGPGRGAVVTAWRAWPPPSAGWLADAAARIGTTLDLAQTANEVAGVAVPDFADAVGIFAAERLLADDEPGTPARGAGLAVRRLAGRVAHQSQDSIDAVLPAGEVLVFDPGTPGADTMATGRPVLSDCPDEQAKERIRRLQELGEGISEYSSFLAMPLVARGTVVGCMMFARRPASPAFTPHEVALAAELTSRAAVCIDNARLYHREQRTALALQRGMLPGQPDIPAGLDVAHCYLPAGASVIGGDWHDTLSLPGGRAAMVVGDAMGHGPEAAAAMVQLRTAAHALAGLELPPDQLLSRLDRMAETISTAPFATCVATVIDPAAGSCTAGLAGHLPPILVLPGGDTRVLTLPPGLPLGLGAGVFDQTPIALPRGATLALYTDGLVESRTRSIDEGIAALRKALSAALVTADAPLQAACDTVARTLSQQREDDTTLVLVRVRD